LTSFCSTGGSCSGGACSSILSGSSRRGGRGFFMMKNRRAAIINHRIPPTIDKIPALCRAHSDASVQRSEASATFHKGDYSETFNQPRDKHIYLNTHTKSRSVARPVKMHRPHSQNQEILVPTVVIKDDARRKEYNGKGDHGQDEGNDSKGSSSLESTIQVCIGKEACFTPACAVRVG